MKNNKISGKGVIFGVLTLFCLSILVNACTMQPATITPTDENIQKTPISLASTMMPVPTTIPTPTATQDNTVDVIRNASESISKFDVYDDFTRPFDESKWKVSVSNSPNSFSYLTQEGNLAVHLGTRLFKNVETLLLEVTPEAFNKETNGISVLLKPTKVREQSHYGVQVNFTDGDDHWIYKVDWNLSYPEITCYLSEPKSGSILNTSDRSFSSQYSLDKGLKLNVEWIPETGLLMTFVDNQLFDYVQVPVSDRLTIESAGLFVKRGALSEGGDLLFSDFRIGSYQESGILLPDDLLSQEKTSFQYTERGIDYYLVDDFEDPSFDGKLNRSRWSLDYFTCMAYPEMCHGQRGEMFQKDGRLVLTKNFNNINIKARDHQLRALQFDIIGNNETLPNTIVVFHYYIGRAPNLGRDNGEVLFEFNCEVKIGDQGFGTIQCVYLDPQRTEALTYPVTLPNQNSNTISMAFNDTLGTFELQVNDTLVGQLSVSQEDQELINQLYTTFGIEEYWDNDSQQIVLDNFLIGYKSDEIWTEPEANITEIVGVLPHSDLFLYDDFESQRFDGAWNIEKWPYSAQSSSDGMWQEDGALIIANNLAQGSLLTGKLDSQRILTSQTKDINAIELEIASVDRQPGGHSVLVVVASQIPDIFEKNEDGTYVCDGCKMIQFGCSIHFLEDHEEMECGPMQQSDRFFYPMKTVAYLQNINSSRSHFLSLELDRENRTYYAYLDHRMVVSYKVPAEFLMAEQRFLLHTYFPSSENSAIVRVDNAYLGINANHPELIEEMKTDKYTPINCLTTGSELVSLPPIEDTTYMIQSKLPDQFSLSEINSISYILDPVEEPPFGWSSNLIFSKVGDDELRFGCMAMYETNLNSRLHCDLFTNGRSYPEYSNEIPFDPFIPHTISMRINPKTNEIYLIWDGDMVFVVDTQKTADYFSINPFKFDIHANMLNSQAGDFVLAIKNLQTGYIY